MTCADIATCTACLNISFAINVSNQCEACGDAIVQCLECYSGSGSLIRCSLCSSNLYFVNSSTGTCDPCSAHVANCQRCDNNTLQCTACYSPYILDYDGSGVASCIPCPSQTFYVNGICYHCSVLIPNCTFCLTTTFCDSCLDNYTYLHPVNAGTQLCFLCSVPMPNCLTCADMTNCTACVDNSFYLDASS